MSLITTNSKVSNRPEHYDNNYPQPIVIKPNSQICLQKFIHTRDTDAFEITQENNVILYKYGQESATTRTGQMNPQRTAVLNTGVYTGSELATEIARAMNAVNQQQNFSFECLFTEDPTAVFPQPTRTFTITTTELDAVSFDTKGGTWTSNGTATRFTIVNNDTANNSSTIKFKQVGGEYGDDCFMRRGILTSGGSHSVSGIKDNKDGNTDFLRIGVCSNLTTTEGDPVGGDGAGFDFSQALQDFSVQIRNNGDAATNPQLGNIFEIHDLEYVRGRPAGSSGWRRERLLRTIPESVLNAVKALPNFRDFRITIETDQSVEDGAQGPKVSNTGGNWVVRLEYFDNTGTLQQIPAGTGGNIDGAFESGVSVQAIQDITIGPSTNPKTITGCIMFTGQAQFIQTTSTNITTNEFVRASRAAYIPTLCTDKAGVNQDVIWYRNDNGNDWSEGGGTFFARWTNLVGEDPDIAGVVAGSVNRGYPLKVEVFDVATETLQATYFCRPQSDATGNLGVSQVNWDMIASATLPAGGAAASHTASITLATGASPTMQNIDGAGATWTGSAAINAVADFHTYTLDGYYNLVQNQVSPNPPALDANGLAIDDGIDRGNKELEDGVEPTIVSASVLGSPSLNSPPLAAPLPRTIFITFDSVPSAANQSVASIAQLLGFLRGSASGTPNYYYSSSTPDRSGLNPPLPIYPFPLVSQVQPTALSGDTTLHISIPQLNNIRTYEGARTDLLQGATNNNAASNGDITNTIAVIPRQEFTSDRDQGELVYVSPFLDWVDINNKTELQINQLTILVRNADGTLAKDLKRETTAIFKLREDPETKRQLAEDARMERFAKMIQNQVDRSVEFTGS